MAWLAGDNRQPRHTRGSECSQAQPRHTRSRSRRRTTRRMRTEPYTPCCRHDASTPPGSRRAPSSSITTGSARPGRATRSQWWGAVCMGCRVHGVPCAWGAVCMGCRVHGVPCAWGAVCMGCRVHGVPCAWGAVCMGCRVHGVPCAWEAALHAVSSRALSVRTGGGSAVQRRWRTVVGS